MKRNEKGIEPATRANKIRRLEKHINSHKHGKRVGNPSDEQAVKALKELKHK